jgi:integrase
MPDLPSITRRSDGRFCATLQLHGKRRYVYGSTEREVRAKLSTLMRRTAISGILPTPGPRTVGNLLDAWLDACRPTLKPRTIATYEEVARRYVRPTLGGVKLARLEPTHVQALYTDLADRKLARAPSQVHTVLHRAFRVGVLWGWLDANLCDRIIPPQYHAPRVEMWTPEQAADFLAATAQDRHGPLFAFLIYTGARIGEATALTWDDVDGGRVTIRRAAHRIGRAWVVSAPKTEAGKRTISLTAEPLSALRTERARQAARRLRAGEAWRDRGLVFANDRGGVLHASMVAHALRDACDRLGLPRLSPHKLRHLSASLLLAANVPLPNVSRRLGHAHSGITARIYSHVVRPDDDAAAALDRALSPREGRGDAASAE